MSSLIFLTSKLQDPDIYHTMKLPMTFVSFGIRPGKMYEEHQRRHTFIVEPNMRAVTGSSVVYGSIWLLNDFHFYSDILDAYHTCSYARMRRNHAMDVNHRLIKRITPIQFASLEELASLRYKELPDVDAWAYQGNPNHPKIIKSVYCIKHSYRVIDGVETNAFTKLFEEVTHERQT